VIQEVDSYGSKSDKGTWSGMTALVRSGIADFGVANFYVIKERSEVVSYTDTLGFVR
jgi:ABC-type amino acid transport substrate-binding protein